MTIMLNAKTIAFYAAVLGCLYLLYLLRKPIWMAITYVASNAWHRKHILGCVLLVEMIFHGFWFSLASPEAYQMQIFSPKEVEFPFFWVVSGLGALVSFFTLITEPGSGETKGS